MTPKFTPLQRILQIQGRCKGREFYVKGKYNSLSPDSDWTGGCIMEDGYYINVNGIQQPTPAIENCEREVVCKASYFKYPNKNKGYLKVDIACDSPKEYPYEQIERKLKKGNRPRLLFLRPKSTTALLDIKEALLKNIDMFDIIDKELPYYQVDNMDLDLAIDNYISKAEEYIKESEWDAVCFVSGGQRKNFKPHYGILHNNQVISFINNIETTTLCAIGHASEKRDFDIAFDVSFGTPSMLGTELNKIANYCKQ